MKQLRFIATTKVNTFSLELAEIVGSFSKSLVSFFDEDNKKELNRSSLQNALALKGIDITEGDLALLTSQHDYCYPLKNTEARNMVKAYDLLSHLDPASLDDFLKLHACLNEGTCVSEGELRGDSLPSYHLFEGISDYVPSHYLEDALHGLFTWLAESTLHPLSKSSIFVYEISRLAPFHSGTELCACLWQKLILSSWKKEFLWLPTEAAFLERKTDLTKALKESCTLNNPAYFQGVVLECISEAIDDFCATIGLGDIRADNTTIEGWGRSLTFSNDETEVPPSKPLAPNDQTADVSDCDKPSRREEAVNDTCSEREEALLLLLDENPSISTPAIAESLRISTSTADRMLANLKKKGKLDREGNRRSGIWVVKTISNLVRLST